MVADNALYYHLREICYLASLLKKKLVKMIVKYDIDYVDILVKCEARNDLLALKDYKDHPGIQNRGDACMKTPASIC